MTRILVLLTLFIFCSWSGIGQDEMKKKKSSTSFHVHEDLVHPSMVAEYEAASRELISLLKTHNNQDIRYGVAMTNDYRFLSLTPLEGFADLDNNAWAGMYEKAGSETMISLWAKFDKCYDQHRSYILVLNHALSYDPNNENMMQDGQNYRRWQEYHVYADKESEGFEIAKAWKALYEESGVETGYRMYTGGLGMDVGTFIVITWGKDADDINAKEKAAQKLMGEKAADLNKRTMAITREYKQYDGQMRLDLSYYPAKKTEIVKK